MKYKNWDDLRDAEKWEIARKEAALETNNGTTKEDLTNIIKFLVQIADHQLIVDFEFEQEMLR